MIRQVATAADGTAFVITGYPEQKEDTPGGALVNTGIAAYLEMDGIGIYPTGEAMHSSFSSMRAARDHADALRRDTVGFGGNLVWRTE